MNGEPPSIRKTWFFLALAGFFLLGLSGCDQLVDGPLAEDPAGTVKTLVATLPVDIELPTGAPRMPTSPVVIGSLEEYIRVYFSDPLAGGAVAGAEMELIRAVELANTSVDMAIYNISLENLANALIDAHRRGVTVRLVMESEAMDRRVPRMLRQAGIPITGDQREGLMHNKFTVIDGSEVFVSSMNYTASSFYNDFNNLVRIRDREMAWNYTVNFEEMFTSRRFGPDKQPNTPHPQVDVAGSAVEVYFSPDDGVAGQVLDELYDARESIHFLAYSYTRDDFAEAMIELSQNGVLVQGVFDADQVRSNTGGEFDNLRSTGLDVRLDGLSGLMHHKVMIIDRRVVITGSYNFSGNAERSNDENLIIIDNAQVAEQFMQQFDLIYSSAN